MAGADVRGLRGRPTLHEGRALRDIGLWVACDEVSVSYSGKLIKVAFVHQAGFQGRVSFSSKGKAVKPGNLRNIRGGQ